MLPCRQWTLADTKAFKCNRIKQKKKKIGTRYLIFVEVEVVVLLRSPGIQSLSLKTFNLLPLTERKKNQTVNSQTTTLKQPGAVCERFLCFNCATCPSTGEGEEPVVMVAGVKAERWRSCAEGTLREGFWLADEEVGHASHPSLSDWLAVLEGQLEI